MYLAVYWGGPRRETRVSRNIEVLLQRLESHWRELISHGFTPEQARLALYKVARDKVPFLAHNQITRLVNSVAEGKPGLIRPVVPVDNLAKRMRRPVRLEDFSHIIVKIEQEDISLEEIAHLANSFA